MLKNLGWHLIPLASISCEQWSPMVVWYLLLQKGTASSSSTAGAAAKLETSTTATTRSTSTAATSSVTNVGASTGAKVSGGVTTTTGSSKVTPQVAASHCIWGLVNTSSHFITNYCSSFHHFFLTPYLSLGFYFLSWSKAWTKTNTPITLNLDLCCLWACLMFFTVGIKEVFRSFGIVAVIYLQFLFFHMPDGIQFNWNIFFITLPIFLSFFWTFAYSI